METMQAMSEGLGIYPDIQEFGQDIPVSWALVAVLGLQPY